MLDFEQTLLLIEKAQNNDQDALNILVKENSPLIKSVIKRYRNKGVEYEDLYQIGSMSFLKAIQNFDKNFNVRFSTYAVPMILGEVRRYLRDNNSIRVSRSLKDIAYKTLKYKEEYISLHGVEPQIEDIAKELGVTTFDIVNSLDSLKEPISMFEAIYNDGGDTIYLCDQIEDKKSSSEDMQIKLALTEAIDNLSDREQHILDQRFVIGKTQMEIADELSISQAQVSRIEKSAISSLKKVLK